MSTGRGGRGGRRPDRKDRKDRLIQRPDIVENPKNKLYVGNLDPRITEFHVVKLFSPFGKIVREQFLWHTHGQRRGEPRGYCFIEYSSREEALQAREKLNGRSLAGRPLVIRFVDEKVEGANYGYAKRPETSEDAGNSSSSAQATRKNLQSADIKIMAIEAKLKMMEQEDKRTKDAAALSCSTSS